jgi:hypothetical protein
MPRPVGAVTRPNADVGTVQIALQVHPGLRQAIEATVREQGLNISTIMRRAVMADLGVDAEGRPTGRRSARGARA